jgi:hypothetical protein
VFSFLALKAPAALAGLARRLLGFHETGPPRVLLWGVPVPADAATGDLRSRLVTISDTIGEDPKRRSEPDVVLDYGPGGAAFIEVKLHAANSEAPPTDDAKFTKYLRNTSAFTNASSVMKSRMYELARNWRIGWEFAGQRPFRLVNLGPSTLFTRSRQQLDTFEQGLAASPTRKFQRLRWDSLLASVSSDLGGMPEWLDKWLGERGVRPSDPRDHFRSSEAQKPD